MHRLLCLLVTALLVTAPAMAWTGGGHHDDDDDDDCRPPRPTVCDPLKKENRSAYTLCIYYCEALNCDNLRRKSLARTCGKLWDYFEHVAGTPPPCETPVCPCMEEIGLFADFASGGAQIEACFTNGTTSVGGPAGFVRVQTELPASCSANDAEPVLALTGAEAQVCREALILAAGAQGIPCGPPE